MDHDIDPIAGNWYRDIDNGRLFQVIDVDEDQGTIEVQHFDGDLEALDLGRWPTLEVELVAAPEDWTGPMDEVKIDDEAPEIRSDLSDEENDAERVAQAAERAADEWDDNGLDDRLGATGRDPGRRRATLFRDDQDDFASPERDEDL